MAAGAPGDAGLGRVPGGARVRAAVDGVRERLRATAHGPLPHGTRGVAAGVGPRLSFPSHDLGRRTHDARDGGRRSGPSRGIRARRGRDPRQPPGPKSGPGRRPLLRHGRDDGEAVHDRRRSAAPFPDLRSRPQLPFQAGERAAGADSRHRDGGNRGRGRVDRGSRRPGADPGGARKRRVGAGAGGVRTGRRRTHGDGRGRRPGADRSGVFRRRLDSPRPGAVRSRNRGSRGQGTWARPEARRARHQRDGGREHVQRGAHARRRVGEGSGRTHAHRLWRLRSDPRGAARRQAGRGPLRGAGRRRRGFGRGLPPGAHLLRGRAQPLHATFGVRSGGGAGGVRRDAGGGGGRGVTRGARRSHDREGARLHALRGPGPRDRRRPPGGPRGRGNPP